MAFKITPADFRGGMLILTVVTVPILLSVGRGMIMLGVFGESDPLPYEVSILLGLLTLLGVPALIALTVHLYRWRPTAPVTPFRLKPWQD